MERKEYLTEERYERGKSKIYKIALIILIVGLSIGGFLIYSGINGSSASKLDELTSKLEIKRKELEDKGIKYNVFAKYTDGEEYELKIITNALDPSFSHCSFDEYKNNSITKQYCKLKNRNEDFAKTGFLMFGVFICIATCMISGSVYMISKRREMLAFSVQQVMPIAQEGIEKMAPSVAKVGKAIAEEMAPVYGDIAKEISKGIKEGLKDEK